MKQFISKWALLILSLMSAAVFFILADVSTNSFVMNFAGTMILIICAFDFIYELGCININMTETAEGK